MFQVFMKRVLYALVVLVIVAVITFTLMRLIPGDPVLVMLGGEYSPTVYAQLKHDLGFDQSVVLQFFIWAKNTLRGDLGFSYIAHEKVTKILSDTLPVTIQLSICSLIVAIVIAIPAGIMSALGRNSWMDYLGMSFAIFGQSLPSFWLGILLIWIFGVKLGLFPTMGYISLFQDFWDGLYHLVMPSVTLGSFYAGMIARITRSSLIDVLDQDYIKMARAKGVRSRVVVYKHAMRNVLIPITTITGLQLGMLLAGAVMTETVFQLPGMGRLVATSILNREYQVVQACILIIAVMFIVINLVVDLLYTFLNPKMRYQ
jgi:peptide/nickel transport system permease protein